jgi:hypothetical protein
MNHMIIPPYEPKQREQVRPPMIYIEKKLKWEYKQIARNLKKEKPLDETELNTLGEEGWEMSGVVQHSTFVYFYFKRLIEK